MEINKKDITIVLQGSCIAKYNNRLCVELAVESIRKQIPECKIILSTWENEKDFIPEGLQVDKIIYNNDPGFKTRNCKPDGKPNNVNRQIVSSINGLKAAETTYSMKMRTDYVMKSTGFIQNFGIYNDFDKEYQIFDKRIICVTPGTRKPRAKNFNCPFHIADHTTFGLTKDLIKLYDIPLVTDEEFDWFMIHTDFMPETKARNRYNAEQSIWINCLIKNGVDVKCEYSTHVNDEIAEQSDRYLVNNFYPISFKKYGIYPLKKYLQPKNNFRNYCDFYTTNEWLHLYRKYCNKSMKVRNFDFEKMITKICIYIEESKYPKIIKSLFKIIRGVVFDA